MPGLYTHGITVTSPILPAALRKRELDSSFNISKRSTDDPGPNIAIISTNSLQVYNTDPIVAAGLGKKKGS